MGKLISSLTIAISMSVAVLLVDRILIISAPLWHRKHRNWFSVTMMFVCFIVAAVVMFIKELDEQQQTKSNTVAIKGLF
jgi:hypothetical protein